MSTSVSSNITHENNRIKVGKDKGLEYVITEQERYEGTTPIQCAKDGVKYLSKLVFA